MNFNTNYDYNYRHITLKVKLKRYNNFTCELKPFIDVERAVPRDTVNQDVIPKLLTEYERLMQVHDRDRKVVYYKLASTCNLRKYLRFNYEIKGPMKVPAMLSTRKHTSISRVTDDDTLDWRAKLAVDNKEVRQHRIKAAVKPKTVSKGKASKGGKKTQGTKQSDTSKGGGSSSTPAGGSGTAGTSGGPAGAAGGGGEDNPPPPDWHTLGARIPPISTCPTPRELAEFEASIREITNQSASENMWRTPYEVIMASSL